MGSWVDKIAWEPPLKVEKHTLASLVDKYQTTLINTTTQTLKHGAYLPAIQQICQNKKAKIKVFFLIDINENVITTSTIILSIFIIIVCRYYHKNPHL